MEFLIELKQLIQSRIKFTIMMELRFPFVVFDFSTKTNSNMIIAARAAVVAAPDKGASTDVMDHDYKWRKTTA